MAVLRRLCTVIKFEVGQKVRQLIPNRGNGTIISIRDLPYLKDILYLVQFEDPEIIAANEFKGSYWTYAFQLVPVGELTMVLYD